MGCNPKLTVSETLAFPEAAGERKHQEGPVIFENVSPSFD